MRCLFDLITMSMRLSMDSIVLSIDPQKRQKKQKETKETAQAKHKSFVGDIIYKSMGYAQKATPYSVRQMFR